jgi:alpha/beta superfamily hydrolase
MDFKKYKFRSGFNWKVKPEVAGKIIDKIAAKNNNQVTPELILDAAKNEKNALHQCFEWDNDKAGAKYRLWQARQLIGSIVVEVVVGEPEETRAFVTITMPSSEPAYYSISDIADDSFKLDMVIQNAKRQMVSIARQLKIYERLQKTAAKIEQLAEEMV